MSRGAGMSCEVRSKQKTAIGFRPKPLGWESKSMRKKQGSTRFNKRSCIPLLFAHPTEQCLIGKRIVVLSWIGGFP